MARRNYITKTVAATYSETDLKTLIIARMKEAAIIENRHFDLDTEGVLSVFFMTVESALEMCKVLKLVPNNAILA